MGRSVTRARTMLTKTALTGLLAGSASSSFAVLTIDVRLPGGGKNSTIAMGETVPLEIYLVGGDSDLAHGLGHFNVSVRSFNEMYQPDGLTYSPWPVARTPADTVANA